MNAKASNNLSIFKGWSVHGFMLRPKMLFVLDLRGFGVEEDVASHHCKLSFIRPTEISFKTSDHRKESQKIITHVESAIAAQGQEVTFTMADNTTINILSVGHNYVLW
jgi:hypothetical protein